MKMNGITTGNVDRNTSRNTRQCSQPFVLCQPCLFGRLRQVFQTLAHGFEFRRLENGGDHRRQGMGDEPLGLSAVSGSAHGAQGKQTFAFLRQAAHQVQHAVNDAPGQIASRAAPMSIVRTSSAPRLGDTGANQ